MSNFVDLINRIEPMIVAVSGEKRSRVILNLVQFFAQSSEIHDEDEVEKLDGLLERCMAEIEGETLIKISHQLSGLTNAPPRSIAWLAHHDDIIIAGPVLAHSPCARESDLLSVAESKGTLHLLAISERPTLNSIVGCFDPPGRQSSLACAG